jgi:hypothetical protein
VPYVQALPRSLNDVLSLQPWFVWPPDPPEPPPPLLHWLVP